MGKNHRHSKKLKSEKNKVQIKSKTKFLPKGQNVTNTAFKIRPIVLQEQLKEASTTRKKNNIPELVNRLKHYNDTVKSESCQELREVIVHSLDSTQIYFSSILQNASALVQDRDRKVRRGAIKLLNAIFENVPNETLHPFFNYILMNLKCAMTNINKNIQEDSLLLLDAILEHKSVLISENFDDFFPNFLLLISKTKNQSGSERSLSLNLEGKVTSVKWRVKVLTRLYGILKAMTGKEGTNLSSDSNPLPLTLHANQTIFIPMYKNIKLYENKDTRLFTKTKSVPTGLHTQIPDLIRLLHEIWMEVMPEKVEKAENGTVLTTEESVAIFSCVVHILSLLGGYVGNAVFCQSKPGLFLDHLLKNFPYTHNRRSLNEITKELPKCFDLKQDQSCAEENLIVAYLYVTARAKTAKGPRNKSIALYIYRCLKWQNPNSFTHLVKILKEVLLKEPYFCRRLSIEPSELTQHLFQYYATEVPEKHKNEILEILVDPKLEKSQTWVEKLPEFLCQKKVSGKLIEGILDLCRKGHEVVQEGVQKRLKRILENLPELEISEVEDLDGARRKLAGIVFYLPNLGAADVEEIRRFVRAHPESGYSRHLGNVLDLRLATLR